MPNATVRANARALPETTSRRAALGAIIAAGAVGATLALPAYAAPGPVLLQRSTAESWISGIGAA
jgi:hypothetical protein